MRADQGLVIGIGLAVVEPFSIAQVTELIGGAGRQLDRDQPAAIGLLAHGVCRTVPIVEIADEKNPVGPDEFRQGKRQSAANALVVFDKRFLNHNTPGTSVTSAAQALSLAAATCRRPRPLAFTELPRPPSKRCHDTARPPFCELQRDDAQAGARRASAACIDTMQAALKS
jgi:hypothetical protein